MIAARISYFRLRFSILNFSLLLGILSPALARMPDTTDIATGRYVDSAAVLSPFSSSPAGEYGDPAVLELPDLIIQGNRNGLHSHKEVSRRTVFQKDLKNITAAMSDPLRAVTALPGIGLQNDLNIRPLVRGGEAGETRVFLNRIPLLQPYHMGGVFSIFSMESADQIDFVSGGFPVEGRNALSGALYLKTRRPSADSLHFQTDMSFLRGSAYISTPLVRKKAAAFASFQSFLFNDVIHGFLNGMEKLNSSPEFQSDIQTYRNHINMPKFQDIMAGVHYTITPDIQLNYLCNFSGDEYQVVIPQTSNIIKNRGTRIHVTGSTDLTFDKEIDRAQKIDVDSVSAVDILNQGHFSELTWTINEGLLFSQGFGYQSQRWGVDFKIPKAEIKDEKVRSLVDTAPRRLDLFERTFDTRSDFTFNRSRDHLLIFGLDYQFREEIYNTNLSYPLYDVIMNSNMDLLSGIGYFSPGGFSIARDGFSHNSMDYVGEYPLRLSFDYQGQHLLYSGALFASHRWELSENRRLFYGLRIEGDYASREIIPSPRASLFQKINDRNEITFSSGLYTQNMHPYYERASNPALKSSKAAHVNLEWTHFFSRHYRLEIQNYYKYYFDLSSPHLVPTGNVDLGGLLLPNPGTTMSDADIQRLTLYLENLDSIQTISDPMRAALVEAFGEQKLAYSNSGIGNALGTEASIFYDPTRRWRGWISLEAALSNRRDHPGELFYDATWSRPWTFNWVNFFAMPSRYELALKFRSSAGHAFTNYTGTLNDGEDMNGLYDPVVVDPRNSSRYAYYSRFDIRLTKNGFLMGQPLKVYLEVWNTFNQPNYFARDSETGQLKSAELNWPFPFLFFGIIYQI